MASPCCWMRLSLAARLLSPPAASVSPSQLSKEDTHPLLLRGEELPALPSHPEHPIAQPVGLPPMDPADPMRPIGHHMMPAPSLPRGGPRLGLKTGSRSRRAGATGARMGVLGWLVASALCAAVRGESVPRDGAEAPGGFGGAPKLGDPPRVSSPCRWVNGNAGQGGEGFLIGCARPRARSPRERRAAGWCSALKAWQGGEDENRATPSQTTLTHAPTPAISLFLQRAAGGGRQVVAGSAGGDRGSRAPHFPSPGAWGTAQVPGVLAPSPLPASWAPPVGAPTFGNPLILGCWGPSERC